MKHTLIYIGAFFILIFSPFATAQDGASFFAMAPDVPLMPGLTEMPDQALTFDKPEGRIVESIAIIDSGSPDDIKKYYQDVLPQFGWSRIGPEVYSRENEHLRLFFEYHQGQAFLRLMITPRSHNL